VFIELVVCYKETPPKFVYFSHDVKELVMVSDVNPPSINAFEVVPLAPWPVLAMFMYVDVLYIDPSYFSTAA